MGRLLFPLTFGGAFGVALWGIEQGIQKDLLLGSISLFSILLIAICERIIPEHEEWNRAQDDVQTDLLHGMVSMVIVPKTLELALHLLILNVALWLAESSGGSLWPSDWPLLLQLIPALLISQFFEYWAHRGMHEVPLLWRLHATHHSPGRLYWLNAARFHPLDSAFLFSVSLAPLLLLGAGQELLLLYTVWVSVHGMFQHCNIRVRLGPLNYIFSMAELHRWHHSLSLEEANSNYGNNILFWDLVFGTVHYPKDRSASQNIGLSELPDFPKDYVGQVLSPWRWGHYKNSND
ncbi:MAG TPA: fatty acid hydroxylase family protein [Myxococcales bacterium]|nr:fatty acid hydroxylase family protein [Myxococcales bacterium]